MCWNCVENTQRDVVCYITSALNFTVNEMGGRALVAFGQVRPDGDRKKKIG